MLDNRLWVEIGLGLIFSKSSRIRFAFHFCAKFLYAFGELNFVRDD